MDKTIETKIPGGKILVSLMDTGDEAIQASIIYTTDEGTPLDIALAEFKQGDLAKLHGYDPANNHIINVYTYEDIYSEEWTRKYDIDTDEFKKIIKEEN